jgi:hypothetical protein
MSDLPFTRPLRTNSGFCLRRGYWRSAKNEWFIQTRLTKQRNTLSRHIVAMYQAPSATSLRWCVVEQSGFQPTITCLLARIYL